MKVANEHSWCRDGNCPCPVRDYLRRQMQCFSFEEIAEQIGENPIKIEICLMNQLAWDAVCRDGELWCPDNPY